jgi:hypothetical protein
MKISFVRSYHLVNQKNKTYTPIGRIYLGSNDVQSAENRHVRIRRRAVLARCRPTDLPTSARKKASFRRLRALVDPERPAPRARARVSPAIPQRPRLTPSSSGRAPPPHCCALRPTARSACSLAHPWYQALLLPERPASRARASPRDLQRSRLNPSSGARVPSLLRTPPLGTHLHLHACSVYACSQPPVPRRHASQVFDAATYDPPQPSPRFARTAEGDRNSQSAADGGRSGASRGRSGASRASRPLNHHTRRRQRDTTAGA